MKIKELETKQFGFVRAKAIAGFWRCGYLSFDEKDMEERGNNYSVMYGRWHRLDENNLEEKIEKEIKMFRTLCFADHNCDGMMSSYEFKEEWK